MAKPITAQAARSGKTLRVMRYVLAFSTVGAIAALAIVWLLQPGA